MHTNSGPSQCKNTIAVMKQYMYNNYVDVIINFCILALFQTDGNCPSQLSSCIRRRSLDAKTHQIQPCISSKGYSSTVTYCQPFYFH